MIPHDSTPASLNDALFDRARRLMPGGVSSPVRAFRGVGGTPRFMVRANGSRVWDAEGRAYLDYIGSWGPMILGHCHPDVVAAVREQAARAMSFGAPSELEIELAELIVGAVPSIQQVRFVNSGTEATMSAIRVARAFTGRSLVIKFEGCYHGHADAFLARAGSGAATLGIPASPGVPAATAAATLDATFNDLASVDALFAAHPDQVAAIIVEPIVGNMGLVPPAPGFLAGLRERCTRHGALLILDEVMTGFRVAWGGAQSLLGVRPDLTTLGKIIGGGLPVGAYGGRSDIMAMVAPEGSVYQAGTLSGNPLAMASGLATLRTMAAMPDLYKRLEKDGAILESAVVDAARAKGLAVAVQRVGSMGTVFFAEGPVRSWADAKGARTADYAKWFWALVDRGVMLPPSQYEAWFHSAAHTPDDIARTAEAMAAAL